MGAASSVLEGAQAHVEEHPLETPSAKQLVLALRPHGDLLPAAGLSALRWELVATLAQSKRKRPLLVVVHEA